MNRNDRSILTAAARKYCSIFLQASHEFREKSEKLLAEEEEKRRHLPSNLKAGSQSRNIEESIRKLKDLLAWISEMERTCRQIEEAFDIHIDFVPKDTHVCRIEDGSRKNRFQILLPDDLLILMKLRSLSMGISCNELICQSLRSELLKDPFEKTY